MKYAEEFRPASLGRYCLREMQMEEVTHRAFMECKEELIIRKYGGQPFLPMWLPEYPPRKKLCAVTVSALPPKADMCAALVDVC